MPTDIQLGDIMESMLLIISVSVIHLGIVIVPGPNFLIIVKNSLTHSRHAGMITARGVAIGTIVYVIAGFLGFTALLSQSVVLFNIVKWIGTIYFVYVGLQLIRSANKTQTNIQLDRHAKIEYPDSQAFRSGLFTMLSNVKSAFYFMFLFTTVLPSNVPANIKIVIIILIPLISFIWYTLLALTFSNKSIQAIYRRVEIAMNYLFGGVWVYLGIRLATVTQD